MGSEMCIRDSTETMEGPTVCTAVQFAQVLFKLAWFFFVSARECAEHLEPWAASRFMHPAPADRDEGWRSLQELWRRGTYLRKKLKLFSAEVTQPAMDRALHTSATRTAIAPLTDHGLQSGFAVGVAGEEAHWAIRLTTPAADRAASASRNTALKRIVPSGKGDRVHVAVLVEWDNGKLSQHHRLSFAQAVKEHFGIPDDLACVLGGSTNRMVLLTAHPDIASVIANGLTGARLLMPNPNTGEPVLVGVRSQLEPLPLHKGRGLVDPRTTTPSEEAWLGGALEIVGALLFVVMRVSSNWEMPKQDEMDGRAAELSASRDHAFDALYSRLPAGFFEPGREATSAAEPPPMIDLTAATSDAENPVVVPDQAGGPSWRLETVVEANPQGPPVRDGVQGDGPVAPDVPPEPAATQEAEEAELSLIHI